MYFLTIFEEESYKKVSFAFDVKQTKKSVKMPFCSGGNYSF